MAPGAARASGGAPGPPVGGDGAPAPPAPPDAGPILNSEGQDLRPALERAAVAAGIPLKLALACAIAESDLNPRAERWGQWTEAALDAIGKGELVGLEGFIEQAWPDISFGYGQRVVPYHYLGDRSPTVENCLAVRAGVFADPERDLAEMAAKLAECLAATRAGQLGRVGGDELLGALVVYNAGHLPGPADPWWETWAGNVASYRAALARARAQLAS